jgi:hypothetical protein
MYEAYYLFLGYISSQLPWTLIFLITQHFGIRLYCLSDRDICIRVQKRINGWCTHKADNDKGYGYSLGYIYFVSITCNPDGDYNCWIIATSDSYNYLTKGKDEVVNLLSLDCLPKEDLKIYERSGSYNNCWFKKRTVKINSIQPRPDQDTILKKIMEHQSKYNHTVVYLHGAPGTGKSIIGVLLANMYKSAYCNTLKLWQPGDTLGSLYSDVEPTADSPLVLVFDEFDGPLTQIHVGVEPHKNLTIQTPDKAGWNQLLDEIHIGMYPYLILVLTSNKSPEYICEMDPSYIRKGRVDLIFEVGKIDSSLAEK